jgi:hypothetical protein
MLQYNHTLVSDALPLVLRAFSRKMGVVAAAGATQHLARLDVRLQNGSVIVGAATLNFSAAGTNEWAFSYAVFPTR